MPYAARRSLSRGPYAYALCECWTGEGAGAPVPYAGGGGDAFPGGEAFPGGGAFTGGDACPLGACIAWIATLNFLLCPANISAALAAVAISSSVIVPKSPTW